MAAVSEKNITIHSQLIPMSGELVLVLPNTSIAEVVAYQVPEKLNKAPDWFLGVIDWRGTRIPVVSFEGMSEEAITPIVKRSRIVILNSLSGDAEIPFYGMVSQGIPRLTILSATNTTDAMVRREESCVMRQVLVDSQPAKIPDQIQMEKLLQSVKKQVFS